LKEDCDLKEIEEEQVIQYIPLSGPSHRVVVTCERSWVACLQETLLSDPDAVCFKFRFGNPEHCKSGCHVGLDGNVKLTIFVLNRQLTTTRRTRTMRSPSSIRDRGG
jgi:hypothetical protein